jgi:hypothetical protein
MSEKGASRQSGSARRSRATEWPRLAEGSQSGAMRLGRTADADVDTHDCISRSTTTGQTGPERAAAVVTLAKAEI